MSIAPKACPGFNALLAYGAGHASDSLSFAEGLQPVERIGPGGAQSVCFGASLNPAVIDQQASLAFVLVLKLHVYQRRHR